MRILRTTLLCVCGQNLLLFNFHKSNMSPTRYRFWQELCFKNSTSSSAWHARLPRCVSLMKMLRYLLFGIIGLSGSSKLFYSYQDSCSETSCRWRQSSAKNSPVREDEPREGLTQILAFPLLPCSNKCRRFWDF